MASVIERTVKGGAGFFTANVIRRALGFLFVMVASRALGPAEFGILALGLSVMGISRRVATFGLPGTVQRFLSGTPGERGNRIYGAVLLVGGILALLAGGILFVTAPGLAAFFDKPPLAGPLRVLSLGLAAGAGFGILRGVLQAQEQIRRIMAVDTVRSTAKVVLLLPLLVIGVNSATNAAWAVAGAFTLTLGLVTFYVGRLQVRPSLQLRWKDLRTILAYAGPLALVGFSYFLARQADRLMLGWLADASSVGIYTVTSKLALVMSTLHGALVSIFKPIASEAYRNGVTRQMRKSYLFVSKWAGTANGIALLGFAAGGTWLLRLFGAEYATGTTYHVLVILAALYFVGTWVGPTGALLQMSDGHYAESINTAAFICTNVVLNYFLIMAFGVIGAAVATFLSGILRNTIQVIQIRSWYGITPFNLRNIGVLGVTCIGTFSLTLMTTGFQRVGLGVVWMLVLAGYAVWAATDEERRSVCSLVRKLGVAVGS